MAGRDRLTQLQNCLDDLLTQMYASLNYIHTRHPYGEIPDQPSQAPNPSDGPSDGKSSLPSAAIARSGAANGDAHTQPSDGATTDSPVPDPPAVFDAALQELAQDLVLKEQQIEFLINALPGIGDSEADQKKRMAELDAELTAVEAERVQKEAEREEMVDALASLIGRVKRVP